MDLCNNSSKRGQLNISGSSKLIDEFTQFATDSGSKKYNEALRILLDNNKVISITKRNEVLDDAMKRAICHGNKLMDIMRELITRVDDAEDAAQNAIGSRIANQERTIQQLHDDLCHCEAENAELNESLKSALEAKEVAESKCNDYAQREQMAADALADKTRIFGSLMEQLAEMKEKAAGYRALKADYDKMHAKVEQLQNELKAAEKDQRSAVEKAKMEIDYLRKEAEYTQNEALVKLESDKKDLVHRAELAEAEIRRLNDLAAQEKEMYKYKESQLDSKVAQAMEQLNKKATAMQCLIDENKQLKDTLTAF